MAPSLYRVTWTSKWTGNVCHHDAEPEQIAHEHLAFLAARHPFIAYALEPVDAAPALPPAAAEARGEPVSE